MIKINLFNNILILINIFLLFFYSIPYSCADVTQGENILKHAYSFYDKGDFINAYEILDKIEIENINDQNVNYYISVLELKGLIKHSTGNIDESKKFFSSALDLLKKYFNDNEKSMLSRLYFRQGSLMLSEGNISRSLEFFKKSNEIAKKTDDKNNLAFSYYGLAFLSHINNDYKSTQNYLSEALTMAEDLKDRELIRIKILTAFSMLELIQKDFQKSFDYLLTVVTLLEKQPDSFQKVISYISLANILEDIYIQTNEKKYIIMAKSLLGNSLSCSENIEYKYGVIESLGLIGRMYELEGKYDMALDHTRQSLFLAQEYQSPDVLYMWQWQLARLLYKTNEKERAINAYRRASQSLDAIKNSYINFSYNNLMQKKPVFSFYLEFADLLLKTARQTDSEDISQKLIFEAREIMEKNKIAELQDYFKDDCVVALQSKTSVLDYLAKDTAIIYPIVFKDRLELLVTFSTIGIKLYSTDITSENLNENIQKFRTYLEKRTTTQFKLFGKNLYDIIIKPLEQDLEKNSIKNLVVVPDSFLRTIPVSALFDGNKFLVEKYAISVTPGLTLTDPHRFGSKDVSILVGGITESVEGFPPLPAVNEEIQAINSLYSSVTLKDNEFTKNNIEDNLIKKEFTIVHIASHGFFEGNINNTFILSYDGRISLTDLQNLMFINIYREKPIELLTLSACDTAAGDERAALGLAGIAVKAGARSAFATLWEVSDIATSKLVANFYKNLSNSHSKAEALRKAQVTLINDENFNHPYYWSPFIIIGNWL